VEILGILIGLAGIAVSIVLFALPGCRADRRTVTVDSMHSPVGWVPYRDERGSSIRLDASAGSGRPFTLAFSLVESGYVGKRSGSRPGR